MSIIYLLGARNIGALCPITIHSGEYFNWHAYGRNRKRMMLRYSWIKIQLNETNRNERVNVKIKKNVRKWEHVGEFSAILARLNERIIFKNAQNQLFKARMNISSTISTWRRRKNRIFWGVINQGPGFPITVMPRWFTVRGNYRKRYRARMAAGENARARMYILRKLLGHWKISGLTL